MNQAQFRPVIERALDQLRQRDRHLFLQNMSERSLTSRLAHHLQLLMPDGTSTSNTTAMAMSVYLSDLELNQSAPTAATWKGERMSYPT